MTLAARPPPMTLRRRHRPLIGLAALLPVMALALVFALVLIDALRQYRAADEARLRDTARALTAAVDARLGTFVEVAQALARTGLLDDLEHREAFAAAAARVSTALPGWFVLVGPGPDHFVLNTNLPLQPGQVLEPIPEGTRAILRDVLLGVFEGRRAMVSDLFYGDMARREILTVMVPVGDTTPTAVGLSLSFGPELLQDLLSRQGLPTATFAAIGDGRFRIVGHSQNVRLVGRPVPEWIIDAMVRRHSALLTGPGLNGRTYSYAVERPTLAPNWTVAVAEPLAMQQASAWRALRWLLAVGATLCLGLSTAVWASRREAIGDARREAAALRTGRAEVDRLLRGLPAVIFLRELAPDRTTRLVSRRGDIETVTGWPATTFAGVDNFQSWVDLEVDDYHDFFDRVVREGAGTIEYRMRQPDGSWRTLRSRCRLLARRQDGVCEVVGYILDVSAEREAEARAVAAARLASLGEMAAGLAHEMKQPLQCISLTAEMGQIAAGRGDTVGAVEQFEKIVGQTQRTAQTIEHLRRFARGTEAGASPQLVPLTAAVEGALDLAGSVLRDASIKVEVELGDPPPVVRGQEVLLEQVLSNFLLNARDALAARPDGAPRRVRITAAPGSAGTVKLTIADTGGGIAQEVMARLFEPFVTTKDADLGTGLGLSICHSLVKGMGGDIEAHNEAEGAVFTITLLGIVQGETNDKQTPNA